LRLSQTEILWVVIIYSLYLGASLFPFARLLGWFRSPRWLLCEFAKLKRKLQGSGA
jgi:hypothetical protein